jgi:hypothetical protein
LIFVFCFSSLGADVDSHLASLSISLSLYCTLRPTSPP